MGFNTFKFICILATAALSHAACVDPFPYAPTASSFVAATSTPYYQATSCDLQAINVGINGSDVTLVSSASDASPSGYTCAQAYSSTGTGYGTYNCTMVPTGIPGTIQSCEIVSLTRNPYESIYAAWIGNNTCVNIGYIANGIINPSGCLKPNMTRDTHVLSILWTPNLITFSIDEANGYLGQLSNALSVPTTPSRFMVSYVLERNNTRSDWQELYLESSVGRIFQGYGPGNTSSSVTYINDVTYTPVSAVACPGSLPPATGISWVADPTQNCTTQVTTDVFIEKDGTNGWQLNRTFGTRLQIVNQTTTGLSNVQVHSGYYSIMFTIVLGRSPTWVQWNNQQPVGAGEYFGFEFWVNGGLSDTGTVRLEASLLLGPDSTSSTIAIPLESVLLGGLVKEAWSRVVLPFALFFNGTTDIADNTNIYGLIIRPTFGSNRVIYFDTVHLIQLQPFCFDNSLHIIDDNVTASWIDQVYQPNNAILQDRIVKNGSYAYQWDIVGNTGLQFKYFTKSKTAPNVPAQYNTLSFWMYTREVKSWQISVSLGNGATPDSVYGIRINLLKFMGGYIPSTAADGWVQLTIPFYEFGITAANPQLTYVVFRSDTAQDQGSLYLDDLKLINQVQPDTTKPKPNAAASLASSSVLLAVILSAVMYIIV